MVRALTDPVDGFLRTARHLIHDRDPLYTHVVADLLTSAGIQPLRLPPRSPNLNAYAERSVRSIKEECLNRVVRFGDGHLRLLTREYTQSTITASETTRDSTTGFCSTRHRRNARPPPCNGATASADSSAFTIERPRDWSAC